MYSQNKEEGVINSLFGDSGRFLEIGAFDGKTFSNTLKLYERGWSGVLVEPSPTAFAGLQREYESKPRVVLINAAVASEAGSITLYDSGGDAISSTDIAHKNKWEKGYKCTFTKMIVRALTWGNIFDEHGTNYDFVNLDTENTNLDLLRQFPFDRCLPMCFCIEHDSRDAEMFKVFDQYQYRVVYRSGENLVMYRGPR